MTAHAEDMDDALTLLKESAHRIIADAHSFEQHRKRAGARVPECLPAWQALAANGLLGATISEDLGGSALPAGAAAIIGEALSLNLAPDPYVDSIVVAAWLIEKGLPKDDAEKWISPLIEGRRVAGFAHAEIYQPTAPNEVTANAERQGDVWKITGQKTGIRAGEACDGFVVSAIVEDDAALGLFLVDAEQSSVAHKSYRTFDGATQSDLVLNSAEAAARLFENADAWHWVQLAQNRADAVLAAQSVSLMRKLLDDTVDYLKTRKQFGVEIGQFQALQHRASDMFIALEEASAMARLAIEALDEDRNADDPMFPATRLCIANTAMKIAHDAVQLHGGMGVSDELFVSHGAKKLKAIAHALGDETFHERRHADYLHGQFEDRR